MARNLLPGDGRVIYEPGFLDPGEAFTMFRFLQDQVPWEPDRLVMFGKPVVTKRKTAWYGDEPFDYRYSGSSRRAMPWTSELEALKRRVEDRTGETYNSCLLNLYHSGEEGMGWHADNEKTMKPNGAIASVSLGASRPFRFKHRTTGERVSVQLEHGSLLLMKGTTQEHWLHELPKSRRVAHARVNLTFRTFVQPSDSG